MNNIPVWLPRVLGVGAGWAATKLTELTGITVDPATLVAVGLGAYALVHRFASSHTNPADAAKRELVAPAKIEVAAQKMVAGGSSSAGVGPVRPADAPVTPRARDEHPFNGEL